MTSSLNLLERSHRFRQTDRWIFSTMLFSACLSLFASFVLAVDAIHLAKDPQVALPCNINEVINCSAVARSWQAGLFGFPNAFLGLMAEPVVLTIAVASLAGVNEKTVRRTLAAPSRQAGRPAAAPLLRWRMGLAGGDCAPRRAPAAHANPDRRAAPQPAA